jgi:hypothetical protein
MVLEEALAAVLPENLPWDEQVEMNPHTRPQTPAHPDADTLTPGRRQRHQLEEYSLRWQLIGPPLGNIPYGGSSLVHRLGELHEVFNALKEKFLEEAEWGGEYGSVAETIRRMRLRYRYRGRKVAQAMLALRRGRTTMPA